MCWPSKDHGFDYPPLSGNALAAGGMRVAAANRNMANGGGAYPIAQRRNQRAGG
jgi:hypothetical protein